MKKGLLAAIPTVIVLSGCAQYEQQQAAFQYQQNMIESQGVVTRVCRDAYNRPEMNPVRAQIPADPSKATVEQLSDTRLPTSLQRQVFANFERWGAVCIQATANYVHEYAPYATQALDEDNQKSKLLLAKMYDGHMTFGEFNQKRAEIHSAFVKEAYAAQNQYRSQQQQVAIQQQQLQAQRAEAAAALIRAENSYRPPQTYMLPIPVPRTTTTNCQRWGNSINCTSY